MKFGDVIKFQYGAADVIAMVMAAEGEEVSTDEDTIALGQHGGILILGLTNEGNPTGYGPYHNVGKTASFRPRENRYEELE